MTGSYLAREPFLPPAWASGLAPVPSHRIRLSHGTPTPLHPWALPGLPAGVEVHVKRDDLTGMLLSGNKARGDARVVL